MSTTTVNPNETMSPSPAEIARRLREPFPPDVVEWKPQTIRDSRAMVCAYIDARVVMDRLDEVLGLAGWQDSYQVLPDGNVMCTLRIRIGDDWIAHTDVGGESDQKDEGDKRKAAFSDALKRVAVKVGIGRYLYRLPSQWVDYDPQKKQLVRTPSLPDWALPPRSNAAPAQGQPARPTSTPPATGASGRITSAQGKQMQALAERKGRTWPQIAASQRLSPGFQARDLTVDVWTRIMRALEEEPDIAPVRK